MTVKAEDHWPSIMGLSNSYPAEFKAEADCALARSFGRKKKEIAESLGISESTLYAWLRSDDANKS